MSSPTPGSDPNHPQGGAPQGQPQWNAPQQPDQGGYNPAPSYSDSGAQPGQGGYNPAPSYSGAPAGYGAPAAQRPGQVTAAAITGIVWGAIAALFSLLLMLAAFGLGAALAGLVLLVNLAVGVALLVGGIFAIQNKPPKLLLFAAYGAIGWGLLLFIISLIATGGNAFSGVLGIIIAGVIVALLMQPQSKQYYASRGMSY